MGHPPLIGIMIKDGRFLFSSVQGQTSKLPDSGRRKTPSGVLRMDGNKHRPGEMLREVAQEISSNYIEMET